MSRVVIFTDNGGKGFDGGIVLAVGALTIAGVMGLSAKIGQSWEKRRKKKKKEEKRKKAK